MSKPPKPQQEQTAWPNLYRNKDKALRLLTGEEWPLLRQDLLSHRTANAERLVQLDEEKHRGLAMKLRGLIAGIDFVLSLETAVDSWKKR